MLWLAGCYEVQSFLSGRLLTHSWSYQPLINHWKKNAPIKFVCSKEENNQCNHNLKRPDFIKSGKQNTRIFFSLTAYRLNCWSKSVVHRLRNPAGLSSTAWSVCAPLDTPISAKKENIKSKRRRNEFIYPCLNLHDIISFFKEEYHFPTSSLRKIDCSITVWLRNLNSIIKICHNWKN